MNRHSVSSLAAAALALAIGPLVALPAHGVGEGLEIFPDERILYLIVLFVVLVFPVNKLLFQPILRVLDEREARIEGTRKKAEEIRARADDTLDRYRSAVRSAREEAEAGRKSLLADARREQAQLTGTVRGEAEVEINRARDEVARALVDARSSLRDQAEELAREAATRILGRSLT